MLSEVRRVEQVMGFPISFDLRDGDAASHIAVDQAFEWLHEVDARFSPFRADSEVSRLSLAPPQILAERRRQPLLTRLVFVSHAAEMERSAKARKRVDACGPPS